MKVLVTGTNSYTGNKFREFVLKNNKEWEVEFLSVRNNDWLQTDFSKYDSIYHVAGLVHLKENRKNKKEFYEVNRDLTFNLAKKAKNEGVVSFIFLSTVAVYGEIGKLGKDTILTKETSTKPSSSYGKSKLEAENLINTLVDCNFRVAVLRIPMIYGEYCPGNYTTLSGFAKKMPIFPELPNKRSMIYIDHLSNVVCYIIEKRISGLYLICNPKDINTSEMVKIIANTNERNILLSKTLGKIINWIGSDFNIIRKIFGNLTFSESERGISGFQFFDISFEETIRLSEKDKKK